jgi:hypothetical protein
MPQRINIMLDDPSWEFLQTVPTGQRSRVMNLALAQWAMRKKHERAALKMDGLRTRLPKVSSDEIVSWLQEDRQREV